MLSQRNREQSTSLERSLHRLLASFQESMHGERQLSHIQFTASPDEIGYLLLGNEIRLELENRTVLATGELIRRHGDTYRVYADDLKPFINQLHGQGISPKEIYDDEPQDIRNGFCGVVS